MSMLLQSGHHLVRKDRRVSMCGCTGKQNNSRRPSTGIYREPNTSYCRSVRVKDRERDNMRTSGKVSLDAKRLGNRELCSYSRAGSRLESPAQRSGHGEERRTARCHINLKSRVVDCETPWSTRIDVVMTRHRPCCRNFPVTTMVALVPATIAGGDKSI